MGEWITQEFVLEMVRKNPGKTGAELNRICGADNRTSIYSRLTKLHEGGGVSCEYKGGKKIYFVR